MTGQELALQRRSLGYTQLELAVLIGTSRAAVNRWENGAKPIRYLVELFMAGLPPKAEWRAGEPLDNAKDGV